MYTLMNCDIVSNILNPYGGQLLLLLTLSCIWTFYFLLVKGGVSVQVVMNVMALDQ